MQDLFLGEIPIQNGCIPDHTAHPLLTSTGRVTAGISQQHFAFPLAALAIGLWNNWCWHSGSSCRKVPPGGLLSIITSVMRRQERCQQPPLQFCLPWEAFLLSPPSLLFPPSMGWCSLSQHCTHGNHFPQLSGPKMLALWTVVLLNSLLISSQGLGIPFSLARADMNGKCM